MSLTSTEMDLLQQVFDEFESDPRPLNGWEQGFIKDQMLRFEQYEDETRFSSKQWSVILKIAEKYKIEV